MEKMKNLQRYKASIIGLGKIGIMYDFDLNRERPSSHTLAYEAHSRVDLVAGVDNRIEQQFFLNKIVPSANFYTNFIDLLKTQSVDIISICTPPVNHLPIIEEIFKFAKSKLIFCEKPLVNNLNEALKLRTLVKDKETVLLPNLSRRWNSGMERVQKHITNKTYGELQKIHLRYTRGIYNTGAHIFDLLSWWTSQTITSVQVIDKVDTSAEIEADPSFTFSFRINDICGFAEAFDDRQYYLFEIDLYFAQGKIEVRNSGNDVFYYKTGQHPLFSGFKSLHLEKEEKGLLKESNLKNAVEHIVRILDGIEEPVCTMEDGLYPLYVAEALRKSYEENKSEQRVEVLLNE